MEKSLDISRRALGEEHRDTAGRYASLAVVLAHQEEYTEAEPLAERALAIRTCLLGEDHIDTAASCNILAFILNSQGKYAAAQPLFETALEVRKHILGNDHPDTANIRNNTAFNLMAQANYAAAQPLFESALDSRLRVLGENHPATAWSYGNLGSNLKYQGRYAEAQVVCEKALEIRRRVLGEDHPDTATSYNNVADCHSCFGRFSDAQPLYENALEIYLRSVGEEHTFTATACGNVAGNLDNQASYDAAQPFHERSLAIRRRVLGENHPDTATSWNKLGGNFEHQGRYAEAHILYERALEICRDRLGEKHPQTAQSYANVGFVLALQGKYSEAQPLVERALSVRRRVLGEDHPDTADSHNALARVFDAEGKHVEAQPLFETALNIRRRALGEDHPDTAASYNNVGLNLVRQEKFTEAHPLLEKSLEISRRVLCEEHPDTAMGYHNIAANLAFQGKYVEAQSSFDEALKISRCALGEDHPFTATVYRNLAENLRNQGRHAEAWAMYGKGNVAFEAARTGIAHGGLERATWTTVHSPARAMACVGATLGLCFEAWRVMEQNLGRGLWDEIAQQREGRLTAEEQQLLQSSERELWQFDRLLAVKLTAEERNRYVRERSAAVVRQGDLKNSLRAKYGSAVGQVLELPVIQSAMSADTALVAWLDWKTPAMAVDPDGDHWAVVVRKTGKPHWVNLLGSGDAGQWVERDMEGPSQLYRCLTRPLEPGDWSALAAELRRQRLTPLLPFLGPTPEGLPAVRQLVVLPSPALAAIPIEIFRGPDDPWTISYAPSGSVYAWLQQRKNAPAPLRTGLLALGDPMFDEGQDQKAYEPRPLPRHGLLVRMVTPGSSAAASGIQLDDVLLAYNHVPLHDATDLRIVAAEGEQQQVEVEIWHDGRTTTRTVKAGPLGISVASQPARVVLEEKQRMDTLLLAARSGTEAFRPLPATAFEVASLARRFRDTGSPVRTLMGRDASEAAVRHLAASGALADYRYVHLATHGVIDDQFPQRTAVILTQIDLPDPLEEIRNHRPMLDGRVSVDEIRSEWQLNADLVTLSACRTALGKFESGEGFVGFTQALLLAGADTICLSLWEVDDTATSLLMDRFYANLLGQRQGLEKPLSKTEALAEAQRWLRELTVTEVTECIGQLTQGAVRGVGHKATVFEPLVPSDENAAARPYSHPYYWAAFVLLGRTD